MLMSDALSGLCVGGGVFSPNSLNPSLTSTPYSLFWRAGSPRYAAARRIGMALRAISLAVGVLHAHCSFGPPVGRAGRLRGHIPATSRGADVSFEASDTIIRIPYYNRWTTEASYCPSAR